MCVSVAELNHVLNVGKIKVPNKGIDVQNEIPVQDAVEFGYVNPFRNSIRDIFNRVFRNQHMAVHGGKSIRYCILVLRGLGKVVAPGKDAIFRPGLHNPRHGPALICDVKQERIVRLGHIWSYEQQLLMMNAGDDYPRPFAVYYVAGLLLNSAKSPNGSAYAEESDYGKRESRPSREACIEKRDAFEITNMQFFGIGLGSFAFGLLMAFCVNHKRKLLCAALIGLPGLIGASSPVWLFYATFVHPYTWGLPPSWVPERGKICEQRAGQRKHAHIENVSQKCLPGSAFLYYDNYMANVLGMDRQVGIIGALCEGSSIRSIERTTGVHRDTVMRLGVRVGQGCTAMMDGTLRDLPCARLEMDEIWGFIGKKEKHVKPVDDPRAGDVWTFCAIDADSKLVPSFKVGKRTNAAADAFVQDVASRMRNRVQISTDGLKAYVDAIEHSFGGDVDYAQIIKTYGHEEVSNNRRYSAPEFVASEKRPIFGNPDYDLISTSYVERLNATTRQHMRRLTRLTLAFSKKFENFEAAVGLHFAYYNFVKRHSTLRMTPAMAAGVNGTQWNVAQLLKAVA